MYNHEKDQFVQIETTCGLLLLELQKIWDEVGEPDVQRDKTLLEIEKECLEVYRRKVDEANKCKSDLKQAIAAAEAEIEGICSALGEQPVKYEQKVSLNLKEELQKVTPRLEEMWERKAERKKQFDEILDKLQNILNEIFGSTEDNLYRTVVDGADLSMEKLEELQKQLHELQNEKNNRLKQVMSHLNSLNSLCGVLGIDYSHTVHDIHPSLDDSERMKDITDDTIKGLTMKIQSLREIKIQRMHRLQDLAAALLELWNLMDTPKEEQQMFQHVTRNIADSEPEIAQPNMLSMGFITCVEEEVLRLEQLKSRRVKEIILKKRLELEEICRNAHTVTEGLEAKYSIAAIQSGNLDHVHLLEEIELEIAKAKEEAFSRQDILDRVEKWLAACEEECWLEEYNRDGNRYNAGRGTHLTLKRAEKARALVSKIPVMVEALTSKITAWEKERGIQFLYNGGQLLSRLEQYVNNRQQKEQERLRQRDQKRLQVQLMAEQETLYGSNASPLTSVKKASRTFKGVASNQKLSLDGAMLHNFKAEKASPRVHSNKEGDCLNQNKSLSHQQYGGFASQSSGKRNSETASCSTKKHFPTTVKPSEAVSGLNRKPLSPVPLAVSSKANIANFLEDHKGLQSGKSEAMIPCIKSPALTPSRLIFAGDEENRTPKTLPIPLPTTPSSVSAPMLMALTPAAPYVSFGAKTLKQIMDQVEYSFEELRAGFICPIAQS